MPPTQRIDNAIARTAVEVLADLPEGEGMHKDALWERVKERHPSVEDDWAAQGRATSGPLTFLQWRSSGMVNVGWLRKDGNGTWCVTGAGRASLHSHPDPDSWSSELHRLYQTWYGKRSRFELAESLLSALPEGTWVQADELASQVEVPAELLAQRLYAIRPEGWHRLLNENGAPPESAHPTSDERALADSLLETDGVTGPNGRAVPHRRLTKADLAQHLTDTTAEAGTEDTTKRRAWLVRGSSVQGTNLVRSLWLPQGVCSLPASRLREVPRGSAREEIAAAVDDAYAHAGAAERDKLTREYHAFLTRMRPGDIVLTNDGASIYIGVIDGPPDYTASTGGRANLQRAVTWHKTDDPLDYTDDLPEEASNRLTNPDAVVIDLTEFVGDLEKLLGVEPEQPVTERAFSLPDADAELAEALLFDQDWVQECIDLLRDQPQLIFYGPPGTGKTYVAQELARHLTGGKPENVQLVQFHPAYSYEDFFEGYRPRPVSDGQGATFELTHGPLRILADAARKHPGEPFVLIIDEINRGNLAKIFGELYFLLEYRGKSVNLLYGSDNGLGFTLPKNIVILATMNTADRSIALVDAAMRRRFWFLELHPSIGPADAVLGRWLARHGLPDDAARLLTELNNRIDDRDFRIGPSYLMRKAVHSHPRGLERVWRHQILPLLEEHHYGDGVDVEELYGLAALRAQLGLDGGTAPQA
ncbi:McrB family protein [Allosalinactinospora lopnorensis]|uniref:McrB family protein n=1 Tax=Allosalinactinospora lopnorensis TaxID=1352348 RepID=UPI000697E8FF|nr:AAA family ATPase [Allosalinactinospora lopnorensis]